MWHRNLLRRVATTRNVSLARFRAYSTDDPNNLDRILPTLMNLPEKPYPNMAHTFRNFIFNHFLIRPYFDPNYSSQTFGDGAKSAIEFVSNCLATGDFETLEKSDALSNDCLQELKRNLSLFSMQQRERLQVSKDDFLMSFIYQIGIMFDDDHDPGKNLRQIL